jgi:hypothetical protein
VRWSRQAWPVHFPPFPGELLTSWLSRLGCYYFLVPSTFCQRTAPQFVDVWKQDLDVVARNEFLKVVGKKCSQRPEKLVRHTFEYWRERFDPYDGDSTALPRWVSPALIRRRSDHHYGVKFCPICLVQKPYHHLFHRLTFVFACLKHKCALIDRCLTCGEAVTTHRVYLPLLEHSPKDILCFCASCGSDYRKFTPAKLTRDELVVSAAILSLLKTGHGRIGSQYFQYSHLYFQGLRVVATALTQGKLLEHFIATSGVGSDLMMKTHDEIEFLSATTARPLITNAAKLLLNWPGDFHELNDQLGLSYFNWIAPRDVVPYWFASFAKANLRKANLISRGR